MVSPTSNQRGSNMLDAFLTALVAILTVAFATWLYSVAKKNVNVVDSLWSLMFLLAAVIYLDASEAIDGRNLLVFTLVAAWSLRLSIHLMYRNWRKPEDRRYRAIRSNNQPFALKSLYIVFGLQALLAWIISAPLLVALQPAPASDFHWVTAIAIALWGVGFFFEVVADWQLLRFQNDPANKGKTLDTGLWRYGRHPNYFGEFCVWWSYFIFALDNGGWWTIFSPILMTILLLRVSGVRLMEKTIGETRPQYGEYAEKTNAFFPGPVKQPRGHNKGHLAP